MRTILYENYSLYSSNARMYYNTIVCTVVHMEKDTQAVAKQLGGYFVISIILHYIQSQYSATNFLKISIAQDFLHAPNPHSNDLQKGVKILHSYLAYLTLLHLWTLKQYILLHRKQKTTHELCL